MSMWSVESDGTSTFNSCAAWNRWEQGRRRTLEIDGAPGAGPSRSLERLERVFHAMIDIWSQRMGEPGWRRRVSTSWMSVVRSLL